MRIWVSLWSVPVPRRLWCIWRYDTPRCPSVRWPCLVWVVHWPLGRRPQATRYIIERNNSHGCAWGRAAVKFILDLWTLYTYAVTRSIPGWSCLPVIIRILTQRITVYQHSSPGDILSRQLWYGSCEFVGHEERKISSSVKITFSPTMHQAEQHSYDYALRPSIS